MQKQLQKDLIQAMKDKDEVKKDTLRLIISEMKNEQIKQKKELNEEDNLKIIKRGIKTRKESIELFNRGNRVDLSKKTQKEIELLKQYLPKQLSGEELENIATNTINEIGAQGPQDIGKVIKAIMSKYSSQADGKTVQQLVSKKLNS